MKSPWIKGAAQYILQASETVLARPRLKEVRGADFNGNMRYLAERAEKNPELAEAFRSALRAGVEKKVMYALHQLECSGFSDRYFDMLMSLCKCGADFNSGYSFSFEVHGKPVTIPPAAEKRLEVLCCIPYIEPTLEEKTAENAPGGFLGAVDRWLTEPTQHMPWQRGYWRPNRKPY